MIQSTSPLLVLDHAGSAASVAVVDSAGRVLASALEVRSQMQAERLALMVQDCLKDAGLKPNELKGIACQRGPGSYTGLRIGAALAQGIALPWNLPILGVSTLETMAWGWWDQEPSRKALVPQVISMIDARRMEVFCGVFGWGPKGMEIKLPGTALILHQEAFKEWCGTQVAMVGDGSVKWKNLLLESQGIDLWMGATFDGEWQSTATSWVGLALLYWERGRMVPPADFRVDYHKEFYSPFLQG